MRIFGTLSVLAVMLSVASPSQAREAARATAATPAPASTVSAGSEDETTRVLQPLPKLTMPPVRGRPPATNLARRNLVLSDVANEVELGIGFGRARFQQVRALPPFSALVQDTTRRTEETSLLWRRRVAKDLDVTVRLPYASVREAQPTRVPVGAASNADVQDQSFHRDGLGDVSVRLSKQIESQNSPMRSQAIDVGWKSATGSSDFPAGTALLSPGTGQQDFSLGYRVKRELYGWAVSARIARSFRGGALRRASDGSFVELHPGDRWEYGVRADRDVRRWLVGSLEVAGFAASRARQSGVELSGTASDFLALEPSVTVSVTDDFEVEVAGQFPIDQSQEPSDGRYGFTARQRF